MTLRWYRQMRNWFYRGPVELGVVIPRRRGYQSPTLTTLLWGYALFCRHFTHGGRVLFLCLGFLLPFSLLNLPMPEYILGFGVTALFLVNFLAGLPLRPRVSFRRDLPPRVRAGTEARVDYDVRNTSRLPCFDLRLDTLPWPKPFTWAGGTAFLPFLTGGQGTRAHAFFRATRRGEFTVPAMRAVSAFPFQLLAWGRTDHRGGAQRILVHPAFVPLVRLAMPAAAQLYSGESGWVSAAGSSHEFVGCREFRAGDLPRHLHWRSWARVGYPVVKEFRDYYQFFGLVVLDVHSRAAWRARWAARRPEARFEAAVSLTAAVCEGLTRVKASVQFVLPHPEAVGATGPCAELEPLLDRLACLQADRHDHFVRAGECLDSLSSDPAFAWVLLLNWNPAREALLAAMQRKRIPFKAIFVTDAKGRVPSGLPGYVQKIQANDIAAGRCRTL